MAYITTEQVKERRQAINKLFPSKLGWKFSITKEHYSSINVHILAAPIELRDRNITSQSGINVRPNSDRINTIGKEVVQIIWDILQNGNFDKSDSMTDYFHVGWYSNIYIGKWNKDFQLAEPKLTDPKKVNALTKALDQSIKAIQKMKAEAKQAMARKEMRAV